MKKQYIIPATEAFALETESLLALSQKDEGTHVTEKDGQSGAWTQHKRNWGKSSPWETDGE